MLPAAQPAQGAQVAVRHAPGIVGIPQPPWRPMDAVRVVRHAQAGVQVRGETSNLTHHCAGEMLKKRIIIPAGIGLCIVLGVGLIRLFA